MRYVLSLLVVILAGCASLPERPPTGNAEAAWIERQSSLAGMQSWTLRARLALRRGDEGAQVALSWVRSSERQRIDLAGPFGGGRVRITEDRDGVELRDSGGNRYQDVSLSLLLARVTGWQLPLEALRHWVLGLPSPAAPFDVSLDEAGRPKKIEQLGWSVQFLDYMSQDKRDLPRRLFVARKSQSALEEALEARIVIEQWNLGDTVPEER